MPYTIIRRHELLLNGDDEMKIDRSNHEIINYVNHQLYNFFAVDDDISKFLDIALQRVENCFRFTKNKYYHEQDGTVLFSPYHSGQYSIFLYYLSNTIFLESKNTSLATRVYYLNRILHSVDWYYEISLPEYWGVEHPLSSVLGRASYSNGFFIYQGCTVGGNKGKYPTMGENVILYSNVTVIGDTKIGNNVIVSTGTTIKDEIIPDNCIVFGQSPNIVIKEKGKSYIDDLVSHFWLKNE